MIDYLKEWHTFNPEEYEKEIYEVMLQDGSLTLGYPNAGMMVDMKNGGRLLESKMKYVRVLEDGWDRLSEDLKASKVKQ